MPRHGFEGHAERFVWPQVRDGVMRMSSAQLAALFDDEEDQKTVRWTDGAFASQ